jgi:hypothetical protein
LEGGGQTNRGGLLVERTVGRMKAYVVRLDTVDEGHFIVATEIYCKGGQTHKGRTVRWMKDSWTDGRTDT